MNPDDPYEALRVKVAACMECQLCATRNTVVVDRGSPTARLLLVGEAPGASEDAEGQAFVGAAGKLLDELLAEASVPLDRFLIANILKCRPANNDFPGDAKSRFKVEDTVLKCLPWLDQQVEIVQPKAIVLIGHKAVIWTVYRNSRPPFPPMSDLFERWIKSDRYPGVGIFVMYHTAYLLRVQQDNPEAAATIREKTVNTLRAAWAASQGVFPEDPPLYIRGEDKRYEQMKFF